VKSPVLTRRTVILVLGLVVLAVVPFTFTESWKQGLAGILAVCLAIWWIVFWWAMGDPRQRLPNVAFVLGVIGGLVLGVLAASLYCVVTDCSAGFDALVLLPAGALLGAFVGGGIGYALGRRPERGSPEPRPRH